MKKFFLPLALLSLLSAFVHAHGNSEPKVGEFVWTELATNDVQGAKDFYAKVFGWEFTDKDMGDMTYTIIKKGNSEFGGIWAIPAAQRNQIPPHWLSYILVENVEQSLEKARKNGAVVLKPVQKAGEMGLFAIIQDPVGAHVALWQTLKNKNSR